MVTEAVILPNIFCVLRKKQRQNHIDLKHHEKQFLIIYCSFKLICELQLHKIIELIRDHCEPLLNVLNIKKAAVHYWHLLSL